MSFWRAWLAHQHAPFQLGLALVLLTLIVIMTASTPTFLTTGNVLNVLRQAAPTLIVAVAMTLVITSGWHRPFGGLHSRSDRRPFGSIAFGWLVVVVRRALDAWIRFHYRLDEWTAGYPRWTSSFYCDVGHA